MDLDIAILRLADRLATYASVRQNVIAENIANSDTPGYKARDLLPFAEAYGEMARGSAIGPGASPVPASTRPGHFDLNSQLGIRFDAQETAGPGSLSPNGNSVAIEDQVMRATEVKLQHDLALGVYAKSLQILRAGLGRR